MDNKQLFWQSYLRLEKELINLAGYVFITDRYGDSQLNVYSSNIADLLVRTCVEIEAISKTIYLKLGGQDKGKDLMFDTDCLRLIDMVYESSKKTVKIISPLFDLIDEEHKSFRPLKEAHKRGEAKWNKAYQAVKHDRYGDESFKKGNVKNLILAMGALYLLNIYNLDFDRTLKVYNVDEMDFSFGSSVFAVEKPSKRNISAIIGPQIDNQDIDRSPFTLVYCDDAIRKIRYDQLNTANSITSYFQNIAESKEEKFQQLFNPDDLDINKFLLLGEYRFSKKFNRQMSFQEKKELLLKSEEWKNYINQINPHIAPNDLNEQNIDNEIKIVGERSGCLLFRQFRDSDTQTILYKANCRLYIEKKSVEIYTFVLDDTESNEGESI